MGSIDLNPVARASQRLKVLVLNVEWFIVIPCAAPGICVRHTRKYILNLHLRFGY